MGRSWDSEWLVSDSQGAFAMGTEAGVRTRKYHGFYLGIAGRSQTAYLADLDFDCQGVSLWPHLYASPQGPLIHPDSESLGAQLQFHKTAQGPSWEWHLNGGRLKFSVYRAHPGGIALQWSWNSPQGEQARLRVRGFWAMRDLHALGGRLWSWQDLNLTTSGLGTLTIGDDESRTQCFFRGQWFWTDEPLWYQNFLYPMELERGYPGQEDLYSAGYFQIQLNPGQSCEWVNSVDPGVFEIFSELDQLVQSKPAPYSPLFDFQLKNPAGIVAGFPWFGEWGRDTFISLPGLAGLGLEAALSEESIQEHQSWVSELLDRWGEWIRLRGCLPNFVGQNNQPQWESCDATLWWCHSLAAVWAYDPSPDSWIGKRYLSLLTHAIDLICSGKHPFLKVRPDLLIEVTEGHTSWMDARLNGHTVTPRVGLLPEINALWFQALLLQRIWRGERVGAVLQDMARAVLLCREDLRPNFVFLHSIPLAPSFVLSSWPMIQENWGEQTLSQDLERLFRDFWSPVGLRTLSPLSTEYRPNYTGHPTERDAAYHQGPIWAWLGGQFQVARDRLSRIRRSKAQLSTHVAPELLRAKILPPTQLKRMPIPGHIAELFDGEPPFLSRGAPAQAWSLACWEEARLRRSWRVDQKLSLVLRKTLAEHPMREPIARLRGDFV